MLTCMGATRRMSWLSCDAHLGATRCMSWPSCDAYLGATLCMSWLSCDAHLGATRRMSWPSCDAHLGATRRMSWPSCCRLILPSGKSTLKEFHSWMISNSVNLVSWVKKEEPLSWPLARTESFYWDHRVLFILIDPDLDLSKLKKYITKTHTHKNY